MKEKVLLIGSGGREHALAWKLLKSPLVSTLNWFPGQLPGLTHLQNIFPDKKIGLWHSEEKDPSRLYAELGLRAKNNETSLVVIGPDQALADGAADAFSNLGLLVFGPSRAAAKLEWSKAFAKEVMNAAKVPTAKSFETNSPSETEALLRSLPWGEKPGEQWVLKADGLALGKGVEVCETLDQALTAMPRLHGLSKNIITEERLYGEEISLFAICDGETAVVLESARDYKTLNEGGKGPNTGGMGSLSPVPGLDDTFSDRMNTAIFLPMLKEMKRRGTPFQGLLYAGLMMNPEKLWVLEFNARFGDPETQGLLPRMNSDLYPWLKAAAEGTLNQLGDKIHFNPGHSVFLVATSAGYPDAQRKGDEITGIETFLKSESLFFAGVEKRGSQYFTSGGRVLGTLGLGKTRAEAKENAYSEMKKITFNGKHTRGDVGN